MICGRFGTGGEGKLARRAEGKMSVVEIERE